MSFVLQMISQMKVLFLDKAKGRTVPICKVFPYWCFNCENFTRNAEVANSPIVKLMRVQNWTFIFSHHQNWCQPPIPPTNAIPTDEPFLVIFSPLCFCVLSFCNNNKSCPRKRRFMHNFAWGWTQILKNFSKLKLSRGNAHDTQYANRVAKCHRYGRYICVNFLEVWGKILESNIRAFDAR